MAALGKHDITHSTRVTELAEAWAFVMDKLDGLDLHSIELRAQHWRQDDDDEWQDTILVRVSGRVEEVAECRT